jgi:protein required for attachment to host cells
MHAFLVVVADSARARILGRKQKFSPPEELESLTHPESRLRRQDLVSDRPGTVHESRTPGESQADPRTDPRDHEAELFARELAARLKQLRQRPGFDGLSLVAEPRFLGLLRRQLDAETLKRIQVEIGANLTREDVDTIARKVDAAS